MQTVIVSDEDREMSLKPQNEFVEIRAVFMGFAISILIIFLGQIIVQPICENVSNIASLFIRSSVIILALLIPIFLMFNHYKRMPAFIVRSLRESLMTALAGIVALWLVIFIFTLFVFGPNSGKYPFVADSVSLPVPFFYVQGLIIVVISPFLEELLVRGFFFDILMKRWNIKIALFITLLFSAVMHSGYGWPGVIYITVFQAIFTFLYIQGGLLSSILPHMAANYFLIYFL
jgi:membrane protease YdiL (CAAX protease family)